MIDKNLKGVWGIYCLKLSGRIIYIGQSIDLYRRLNEHSRQVKKALKGKLGGYSNFKYNHIASAVKRGAIITYDILEIVKQHDRQWLTAREKYFIRFYRPQFNIEGNGETVGSCNYSFIKRRVIDADELVRKKKP